MFGSPKTINVRNYQIKKIDLNIRIKYWTFSKWKKIVWSDESTFSQFHNIIVYDAFYSID
ncbi:2591_t:CDS:2 [Funneliformis geosporum]|uniref:2591_t:CDS:1 n=1 Tax=Funneliformis geosporum TaxID=1117311 RepID=A0A9W4WL62_9GLOM|nr:2591_t:CDS:2 [Funneliformis geosporum]